MKYIFVLSLSFFFFLKGYSQCTFQGTNPQTGQPYTITVSLTPVDIVITNCDEPNGYNYNVELDYTIAVTGTLPTWAGGNIFNLNGTLFCGSQNQFFDLPETFANYSGTVTSQSNQYVTNGVCSEASVASLDCNTINLNISGPGGLNESNFNCDILLPIKLTEFSAVVNSLNQVELSWQTASEVNNDFFTLEYSTNGLEWNLLANIDGQGNSSQLVDYSFIDSYPTDKEVFYRLMQTDFDGQTSFSDIVKVELEQINESALVFPNPANDFVTILQKDDFKILGISNQYGRNVSVPVNRVRGNELQIGTSHLPAGVYFVNTTNGVFKFLKR